VVEYYHQQITNNRPPNAGRIRIYENLWYSFDSDPLHSVNIDNLLAEFIEAIPYVNSIFRNKFVIR